ncbi:hypothetical protein MMC18_003240 [Xylographa bjoerkii]|nr:hypothetical protein [Xylographa bjoerkii]
MECVNLDEANIPTYWICDACRAIPRHQRKDTKDLDIEYDEVANASSYRVQRTQSLSRAWNDHSSPTAAAIQEKVREITLNLDVVKSAAYPILHGGVQRDLKPPRYWVIDIEHRRKLIMASSRKQQLVYHPEITDIEDNGSSDTDETENLDSVADEVRDAFDVMSLGSKLRK